MDSLVVRSKFQARSDLIGYVPDSDVSTTNQGGTEIDSCPAAAGLEPEPLEQTEVAREPL